MNPTTGTFISMDTYQGTIFDPTSLHKYLYANANPVMNVDPTGFYSKSIQDVTGAVACMGILAASCAMVDNFAMNFYRNFRLSSELNILENINELADFDDISTTTYTS